MSAGGPSIAAHGWVLEQSAWRFRFSSVLTPALAMTTVASPGTASLPSKMPASKMIESVSVSGSPSSALTKAPRRLQSAGVTGLHVLRAPESLVVSTKKLSASPTTPACACPVEARRIAPASATAPIALRLMNAPPVGFGLDPSGPRRV